MIFSYLSNYHGVGLKTSFKTQISTHFFLKMTHLKVHVASPHNVEVPQPKVMLVDEGRPYRLVCKLVAEFLGTMIFVYIGKLILLYAKFKFILYC